MSSTQHYAALSLKLSFSELNKEIFSYFGMRQWTKFSPRVLLCDRCANPFKPTNPFAQRPDTMADEHRNRALISNLVAGKIAPAAAFAQPLFDIEVVLVGGNPNPPVEIFVQIC